MVYSAGRLASKFLKVHSCVGTSQKCELRTKIACFSEGNRVLLYLSVKGTADSDFGYLSVPFVSFRLFVEACEVVFETCINSLISKESVGRTLCVLFHQKIPKYLTVCDESVYDNLFSLIAKVRLHWFMRKKMLNYLIQQQSVKLGSKCTGYVRETTRSTF
uniref:Putative p-element n=1 Tax=Ixodes ricinus TaxID=34613 RepID=A0A0K8RAD5_IXORI